MKIAVLLPARNEELRIGQVIRDLKSVITANSLDAKICVVDDGSEDNTLEVAYASGADIVLDLEHHRGVGSATREGIAYALKDGADTIVLMDSDGQHDPAYVPFFVDAIQAGGYDMAVGFRCLDNYPALEKVGNKGLSVLSNLVASSGIKDIECGYRALSSKALREADLKADGYEICADFAYSAHKNKWRIKNIPMKSSFAGRKPGKVRRGIGNFLFVLGRVIK